MEIKDRVQRVIDSKGLDIKAFERELGLSNGSWAKADTISEKVLLKVIRKWPELNSAWIMKGKGEMFAEESDTSSNIIEEITRLKDENKQLREQLRLKDDPDLPRKESEVYQLWMEYMKLENKRADFHNRMQELFKNQKEG